MEYYIKNRIIIPNIILHGNNIGKTFLVNKYIESVKDKITPLKINCSLYNGINIFRNEIKKFLLRESVEIKLIILDDGDLLTKDSQYILRGFMENYNNIARFCLICRNVYKIDLALKSRCYVICMKQQELLDNGKIYPLNIEKIYNNKNEKEILDYISKYSLTDIILEMTKYINSLYINDKLSFEKYKQYMINFKNIDRNLYCCQDYYQIKYFIKIINN